MSIYGQSYAAARAARLAFAEGRCEVCGHDGGDWRIEAHHRGPEAYERDRRGVMTLRDLVILCVRCHDCVTDRDRRERYAARAIQPIDTINSPMFAPVAIGRVEIRPIETAAPGSPVRPPSTR